MTGWRIALPLLAGIVLFSVTPAVADMVLLTDGTWLVVRPAGDRPTPAEIENSRITVVSEQYDVLVFRILKVRTLQTRPARDIARVFHAQTDQNFERAVRLIDEKNLEGALEPLARAVGSKIRWVPQYASWHRARVLERLGRPREAVEAIEALIKRIPKTRFLVPALRMSGRLYLERLGDAEKAARQFRRIRSIPGIDEETRTDVDYRLILVDERRARTRDEVVEVKERFRNLVKETEARFPAVAARARLGVGRCLIALDESAEALAFFQAIVDGSDGKDEETLAGAYVGIGDAWFRMENWLEARRAYLRVGILWEEYPDHHAKALCLAGNCFLLARDGDFRARARRELRDCLRLHPGTVWAEKARDLVVRTSRASTRPPR